MDKKIAFLLNKKNIFLFLIIGSLLSLLGYVLYFKHLRPEIEYLLGSHHPAFKEQREFNKRFAYSEYTLIYLQFNEPKASELSLPAKEFLEKQNIPTVELVKNSFVDEIDLIKKNSFYYFSIHDIVDVIYKINPNAKRDDIDRFTALKKNFQSLMKYKENQSFLPFLNSKNKYLVSEDNKSALILILHNSNFNNIEDAKAFQNRVEGSLQEFQKIHPALSGYTFNGQANNLVRDYKSLWEEISLSSAILSIFVFILLIVFFRSLKITLLLFIPVWIGLGLVYLMIYLFFDEINSNTFFISMLFVGSSLNFGIIYLGHLKNISAENQRKKIELAFNRTLKPSFIAMMTTSVVYIGLVRFSLKGFSDVGLIGIFGLLICWLSFVFIFPYFSLFLSASDLNKKALRVNFLKGIKINFSQKQITYFIHSLTALALILFVTLGLYKDEVILERDMRQIRNAHYEEYAFNSFAEKIKNYPLNIDVIPTGAIITDKKTNVVQLKQALQDDKVLFELLPDLKLFSVYSIVPTNAGKFFEYSQIINHTPNVRHQLASPLLDRKDEQIVLASLEIEKKMDMGDLTPFFKTVFNKNASNNGTDVLFLKFNLNELEKDVFKLMTLFDRVDFLRNNVFKNNEIIYGGIVPLVVTIFKEFKNSYEEVYLLSFFLVLLVLFFSFKDKKMSLKLMYLFTSFILCYLALFYLLGFRVNVLNYLSVILTMGIGVDYTINLLSDEQSLGESYIDPYVVVSSLTTLLSYLAIWIGTNQLALTSFAKAAILGEITAVMLSFIYMGFLKKHN